MSLITNSIIKKKNKLWLIFGVGEEPTFNLFIIALKFNLIKGQHI